MIHTLTIVKKQAILDVFDKDTIDRQYIRRRELEVCNGLRAEADKRREEQNGARC